MHAMSRKRIKRRSSTWETAILVLIGVFAYLIVSNFSDRGIPEKWATATVATLITFGFVIYARRETLGRWSFWLALGICLVPHTVILWLFFRYILSFTQRLSILFWLPFMLVEVFVLLIAIKRIEGKLGQNETIKLRF
jgi:hypothetical protein